MAGPWSSAPLSPKPPIETESFAWCQARSFTGGEGIGQAGRRRQWARQEEEKASWEREGQWLARLNVRNLAERGDFPSP